MFLFILILAVLPTIRAENGFTSSWCGSKEGHSSTCLIDSIIFFFDILASILCLFVVACRPGFFKTNLTINRYIRGIEIFCAFLVGFMPDTWTLISSEGKVENPCETGLIFSKAAIHFVYLFVSNKIGTSVHNFFVPFYMAARLAVYMIFFYPWKSDHTSVDFIISTLRTCFRGILFIICVYQVVLVIKNKISHLFRKSDDDYHELAEPAVIPIKDEEYTSGHLLHVAGRMILKAYRSAFKYNKILILLSIIAPVGSGILEVVAAVWMGDVVDSAISGHVVSKTGFIATTFVVCSVILGGLDSYLRGVLSQKLLYITLKTLPENSVHRQRLNQNFLEIRLFYQYNIIDCTLSIIKITTVFIYSCTISWDLTLLSVFLLPLGVPFKIWEIEYSRKMKEDYANAQQKIDEDGFENMDAVVQKDGILVAIFCYLTRLITLIAVIFFVWLGDSYPNKAALLSVLFSFNIVISAIATFSENAPHIFQTIALCPKAFEEFGESREEAPELISNTSRFSAIKSNIGTLTAAMTMMIIVAVCLGLIVTDHSTNRCDISIIGGGVGGLWSAMRLKESGKNVCIFEQSNEVGGRLKTRYFDGTDIALELGGMQFLKSHRMLYDKVQEYNLSYFPRIFPENNFDFLRNRRVPKNISWLNATSIPYFFSPEDMIKMNNLGNGASPYGMLSYVIEKTNINVSQIGDWTTCDWENWRKNSTWKDTSENNYNLGWWYALLQTMSPEIVAAYSDSSGYDSFVEQSNLADVISYVAPGFSSYDETGAYNRFTTGFETIPKLFYHHLQVLGIDVQFGKSLSSMERRSDDEILLTFEDGTIYSTNSVILALPQKAIKTLSEKAPQLANINSSINGVFAVPAFKIFLIFDTPWWLKFGFDTGVMSTSYPARKIYYWGIEGNNSVVMATYDDDYDSTYWSNMLSDQEPLVPFYFRPDSSMKENHSFIDLNGADMRSIAVRSLMEHIRFSHNDSSIPDPFGAIFQDWSRAPFGGAWHAWSTGVVSSSVRKLLRNIPDSHIMICGEAYSDHQGWVEGALRSCEKMLIENFDLKSNYSDYLECS